jgi:sugar phosphate isomerase/epimerase
MLPYTRRDFAKLAFAALPAAGFLSVMNSVRAAEGAAKPAGKPNSKFAGVQIGLNVPYSLGNNFTPWNETLEKCVQLGISAIELRTQPVEAFLGVPENLINARAAVAQAGAAGSNAEQLRAWRKGVSMDRVKAFRKNYEDAGVKIEIVKVDNIFKMSEEEVNYAFTLAKNLGARAISTEISKDDKDMERIGKFADQHALMIGYHGHATTTPEHWETAFSFAKHNGANLDIGHFVAGNHGSPVEFMKKHHARITHIHVKDRKKNEGPNTVFGEGDTPIVEVLRLIRDNKWPIQATIEFEYRPPAGSDRMTEIARAIKYCRDALV